MTITGADWSSGRMDYVRFAHAGMAFAARYAVPTLPGKSLTRNEVDAAHWAGVSIMPIYETTGTTWRGGRAQGVIDGKQAFNALSALDAPSGITCYHAVDEQITSVNLPWIDEWVAGIAFGSWPYDVGIYGQYLLMEHLHSRFPSVKLWQTPAWSFGQVSDHINVLQGGKFTFAGIDCDHDTAVTQAFGQWAPFMPPTSPPLPKEQDMFIVKVTAPPIAKWSGTRTFTYNGTTLHHIVSGTDQGNLAKELHEVPITWEQFIAFGGATVTE